MFRIYTTNNFSRILFGTAPDLESAKAMIPGEIHYIEEDPDHPQCFDLINSYCEPFAIEIATADQEKK